MKKKTAATLFVSIRAKTQTKIFTFRNLLISFLFEFPFGEGFCLRFHSIEHKLEGIRREKVKQLTAVNANKSENYEPMDKGIGIVAEREATTERGKKKI